MKTKFTQWYADQVHSQLANGREIEEIKVGMSMSFIKCTRAKWIVFAYDCILYVPDVICNGFSKAGIVDAVSDTCM